MNEQVTKKKRGRPRGPETEIIHARIPVELMDRVRCVTESCGGALTVTEIVRDMLTIFVKAWEELGPPEQEGECH